MPLADKLKRKQQLLTECLRLQNQNIDQLRATMIDAQQSANDNEDDTEEKLYNSYREEMQNKRDMFARQLDQAIDDRALLQKVTATVENKDVSLGAVVETSAGQKLFISISLGQIKIDGDSFFAISPAAPLFKAMAEKKAGDSYTFRDQKLTIVEVF
jgi:transcription elongation GreA/GreB family factor